MKSKGQRWRVRGAALSVAGILTACAGESHAGTLEAKLHDFLLGPEDPVDAWFFGDNIALDEDLLAVTAVQHFAGAPEDGHYPLVSVYSLSTVPGDKVGAWFQDLPASVDYTVPWVAVSGKRVVHSSAAPTTGTTIHELSAGVWSKALVDMGRTAFVAASGDSVAFYTFGGGVDVYDKAPQGWVQGAALPLSNVAGVALAGDLLAAVTDTDTHVFARAEGMWAPEAVVPNPPCGGAPTSIAMSGETLVLGCPGASGAVEFSGLVYVFDRSGGAWPEQAELAAADAAAKDQFGYAVAIRGSRIAVGAPEKNGQGALYVFEDTGGGAWSQVLEVPPTDPSGEFGKGVAISGGRVAVSAPSFTASPMYGNRAGAVFVYDLVSNCMSDADCAMGTCVDGVCCEDGCGGGGGGGGTGGGDGTGGGGGSGTGSGSGTGGASTGAVDDTDNQGACACRGTGPSGSTPPSAALSMLALVAARLVRRRRGDPR